jgi:hypothetical protein
MAEAETQHTAALTARDISKRKEKEEDARIVAFNRKKDQKEAEIAAEMARLREEKEREI